MAKEPSTKRVASATEIGREAVREHLRRAGRKGGQTMKKRGSAYYKMIGKKGAEARWNKKKNDEQRIA